MTTFEEKLDAGVAKIKASADLWDLHQALVAFEQTTDEDGQPPYEFDTETTLRSRGVDICELPVFGGEFPKVNGRCLVLGREQHPGGRGSVFIMGNKGTQMSSMTTRVAISMTGKKPRQMSGDEMFARATGRPWPPKEEPKPEPPRRRQRLLTAGECAYCDIERKHGDGHHPPHDASPRCESGGHNHCTCDVCF